MKLPGEAQPHAGSRSVSVKSSNLDAKGLERVLRSTTHGEVRFTDGDRALYSTDSSNYRQVPIGS